MKILLRVLPLLLVTLAWILAGCSHNYLVTFEHDRTRGDTVTVGTVNRRLEGRSASIITRDSTELSVSDVLLTRDSCIFAGTTGRTSMPTADVLAIRRDDHFSSAVGGFGLGLLSGFVVGAVVAFAVVDRGNADSRMGAGLLAIGLTAGGSVIGLIAGAFHGTIIDYTIPQAIPDSTRSSRISTHESCGL